MELKKKISINLEDTFFNSLKSDNPEFSNWFLRKSEAEEEAFTLFSRT